MTSKMRFVRNVTAMWCVVLFIACWQTAGAAASAKSFPELIAYAQASASANQPRAALSYYTRAWQAARGDRTRQRIALFGIAHMQLWLGRYAQSERSYRTLLASDLSAADRNVALAGLVESLDWEGRPMAAYSLGAATAAGDSAELVAATSAAAADAGWPDKDGALLAASAATLAALSPGTRTATIINAARRDVAAALGPQASLGYSLRSDSDGLRIGAATARVQMRAGLATSGWLDFARTSFTQGNWNATGQTATLGASSRLQDHTWLSADVGLQNYPGWQTGTYHSNITVRPDDEYGLGVFGSREVIETRDALARHLASSQLGVAGDAWLSPQATIAGSSSWDDFSDGNRRVGLQARANYIVDEDAGFSAHMLWTAFADSRTGSAAYFDPQHYGQLEMYFTETRWFAKTWHASVSAGLGRQVVNTTSYSTTASYETSVTGYLKGCAGVQAAYGYSNSALASSSGYQRHYTSLSLSCLF
jgi:hypothetical protein